MEQSGNECSEDVIKELDGLQGSKLGGGGGLNDGRGWGAE